ncbi:MAG: OmpA family protein, partial [Deltaproteobacteria bacterium]|nr:OmpA family protein [Deltaproteobacteria bacterium]
WTYEATVLFDFDSAIIISEDVPMLNEAVVILNNNPALRAEVDGYTDITGPEDYNQVLSEKRANAVMHYFVERGIAAKRLVAKGFGFNNPAASNSTKEGRAKNRRVELKPIK